MSETPASDPGWTSWPRRIARLVGAILIILGIERMLPDAAWYVEVGAYVIAAAVCEWGWCGTLRGSNGEALGTTRGTNMRRWLKLRLLRAMAPKAKDLEADLRRDREINPILASDHPYFHPLPDPRDEALAAHLHRRWQEHEAVVAGWSQPEPRPWDSLEPDQKRGYRAIAIAAREFLSRNE